MTGMGRREGIREEGWKTWSTSLSWQRGIVDPGATSLNEPSGCPEVLGSHWQEVPPQSPPAEAP
jgi:hypothetical protein